MMKVFSFELVDLGVDPPDYFPGFGSGSFENSTDGIGLTPSEALADCLDLIAMATDIDTLDLEARIIDEYGEPSSTPQLVMPIYHIGIRWNLYRPKESPSEQAPTSDPQAPIEQAPIRVTIVDGKIEAVRGLQPGQVIQVLDFDIPDDYDEPNLRTVQCGHLIEPYRLLEFKGE
jgi:hypothetical protein